MACMPICAALILQMAVLPDANAASDTPRDLAISIGQRKDNLNWNIASGTVNVLSELKWENMAIFQIQAAGELHLKNDRRLRAMLGYGVIGSGTNQDSDYNGNNRTQEFSRSNNKAGGNVLDASIGIGKVLRLHNFSAGKLLYVTPLIGVSMHRQNLTMTDGVQTIPATGPFPGLASSYDALWMGPWVGAEVMVETERGWEMRARADYHVAEFSAKANWNLRLDLAHPVSFRHTATGNGIALSLEATYPAGKNLKAIFWLEHHQWTTRAGSDRMHFADGTVGYARLNGVNWNSTSYNFGFVRKF